MHEHGTEHLAKRAASIEKRIARMKVTDRPKTDKKMTVTFGDPNYETEEVLKVRDITKSYDGREILHDVSFNIRNRERVALLGANGAGKTTMLKILLGEETPDSGVIRKGVGLKPAYLPQQVHFANPHRNLIDTLIYDKNVSMQVARNRLGSFQFTGETQMKTVDMLSGGEKSRLRLCELMYDPLNLLILDEPTNHLDLASREWIEEAVEAFDGTLLFVSHDRYFVERFATRVLYLENGRLIDFIGSYSAFLDWRAKGGGALPEAETAPVPKKKKRQLFRRWMMCRSRPKSRSARAVRKPSEAAEHARARDLAAGDPVGRFGTADGGCGVRLVASARAHDRKGDLRRKARCEKWTNGRPLRRNWRQCSEKIQGMDRACGAMRDCRRAAAVLEAVAVRRHLSDRARGRLHGEWLMLRGREKYRACRVLARVGQVLFSLFVLTFALVQICIIGGAFRGK